MRGWLILLAVVIAVLATVDVSQYNYKTFAIESNISVYFCPQDKCDKILIDLIESSNKVECALYSLSDKGVISALDKKQEKTLITQESKVDYAKTIYNENGIMHNKFCIFDNEIVLTGSYNPTTRQAHNNIVVIKNKDVAEIYTTKLNELGTEFVREKQHEFVVDGINISVYFCPENFCSNIIINEINKSDEIYFMAYAFTNNEIADVIKSKRHFGILESQQIRNNTVSLNSLTYKSKHLMHHKVFILDNSTVITGSMNPSYSGDYYNDENIVIIRSKEIAEQYLEEIKRLS